LPVGVHMSMMEGVLAANFISHGQQTMGTFGSLA
jgi:hypothetical protein